MAQKLLIAGDSFAAKYPNDTSVGWPLLLKQYYDITNTAQAGVSEYKILKQLKSVSNIGQYSLIIIAHTSPYRVHTRQSIHSTELHKDCDLLMSDIDDKFSIRPSVFAAKGYFKHHFDPDYYEDMYSLLRKEIQNITRYTPTLHIDHFESSLKYAKEDFKLDLPQMWPYYKGNINHYTPEGNQLVCARILEKVKELR